MPRKPATAGRRKPSGPCTEELSFRAAMRADWTDDTCRLVYSDWLDDHDRPRPAARLRWWVGASRAIRAGLVWDRPRPAVEETIELPCAEWVQRLYAVEVARTVRCR